MTIRLYDSGERRYPRSPSRLLSGVVVNDLELATHGNILVRVPALHLEVWARLVSAGGGQGTGIFFQPRVGDEVLVALSGEDAFVIGGMHSPSKSPPVSDPLEAKTKRVIQTGLAGGVPGHRVEFDDAEQTITIESSTRQKITVSPTSIELANTAGTLVISMSNTDQTISITGVNVEITARARLSLSGRMVEIAGTGPVTISSAAPCTVKGKPIQLNPPV
ncbi:phage baseplate assembly protein V [Sphaerisporangium rhizosphaerae]|uniref:Phage baseplate assembly protein V n=1 Tax=Sphaerisporangium rhizosphaerae TaxID=2269375 RepID=A0ABW2PEG1_9ACTN